MSQQHITFDPRGVSAGMAGSLAARRPIANGVRALVIDNGKLSPEYGPYAAIVESLASLFPQISWTVEQFDLLRYEPAQLSAMADDLIARHKPGAVVVALADAGVSVQTTVLAGLFEARGVPSVVLATRLGQRVCAPIAQCQAPGLPVIGFDTQRTDSADAVRALMADAGARILAGLTEAPALSAASGLAAWPDRWSQADDSISHFQDWLEDNDLGDGLPLIPPTMKVVDALLRTVPEDAETVLYGPALTSGRLLRVIDVAANAAMTACPAKAFPVVVAAIKAIAVQDFRLSQAAITTHPSGYAVVLAGCDPATYGLSGGAGCLGPGHRGNASVGRAVSLCVQHLFGARPGGADLTIFGSPAEFSYCFAESRQGIPWTSMADDFGSGAPGVLVMKAEGPRNVLEHLAMSPMAICEALAAGAASRCSNNSFIPGDLLVMINPEHAGIFVDGGWNRRDVAIAIHELARLPRPLLEGRGVAPFRPRFMDAMDQLPVTRSPDDVHIVVAGAAGPQSMVALPWGYSRAQWHRIRAS